MAIPEFGGENCMHILTWRACAVVCTRVVGCLVSTKLDYFAVNVQLLTQNDDLHKNSHFIKIQIHDWFLFSALNLREFREAISHSMMLVSDNAVWSAKYRSGINTSLGVGVGVLACRFNNELTSYCREWLLQKIANQMNTNGKFIHINSEKWKSFYTPRSWTGSGLSTFTSRFKCARTWLSKGHIEFKTAGLFVVRWLFVRRWLLLRALILLILLVRGIIVCANGAFCSCCIRFFLQFLKETHPTIHWLSAIDFEVLFVHAHDDSSDIKLWLAERPA